MAAMAGTPNLTKKLMLKINGLRLQAGLPAIEN